MWALTNHFLRSLINWVFRRRSPALFVMRFGLAFTGLGFGTGWVLNVSIPFRNGVVELSFDSAGGAPLLLVYGVVAIGLALTLFGLGWEIVRYTAKRRRLDRKKVIVIEARGLRDTVGTPLIDAIPSRLEGHRENVLVDLRQGIKDGEITAPDAAIEQLVSLPTDLKRRENGFDRRDIKHVYGGLTPVPFTFLTGVLLDDECAVTVFDWDRHAETWRELDGSDDGMRFSCSGLENIPVGVREVAVAVSVSYGVMERNVRAKVGEIPFVELKLDRGSPDCCWSEEKQRTLGSQFLETMINIGNRGIQRIHLFLAAQNSVVFRFGRLYDKRNLPEIIVYQYQISANPPYPWGLLMPVSGVDRPVLIADTALK